MKNLQQQQTTVPKIQKERRDGRKKDYHRQAEGFIPLQLVTDCSYSNYIESLIEYSILFYR